MLKDYIVFKSDWKLTERGYFPENGYNIFENTMKNLSYSMPDSGQLKVKCSYKFCIALRRFAWYKHWG